MYNREQVNTCRIIRHVTSLCPLHSLHFIHPFINTYIYVYLYPLNILHKNSSSCNKLVHITLFNIHILLLLSCSFIMLSVDESKNVADSLYIFMQYMYYIVDVMCVLSCKCVFFCTR